MVISVAEWAGVEEGKAVEEGGAGASGVVSRLDCSVLGGDASKRLDIPGRASGPIRRSTKGGWTEEEDILLANAVKQNRGKNWKKIAELFPGKKDVQCLHRWQKVLDPELVKGTWTKEEDELIIKLVEQHGQKKWSLVAQSLPGRIGKQCRERWHNHLNPEIKREAWTIEEEIILIRAHQIHGNKWAEIAKILPGRADNAIKNHWNCSVKKKLDYYISSGLLEHTPETAVPLHLTDDKNERNILKDHCETNSRSGDVFSVSRETSNILSVGEYGGNKNTENDEPRNPDTSEGAYQILSPMQGFNEEQSLKTDTTPMAQRPAEGKMIRSRLTYISRNDGYPPIWSNASSRVFNRQDHGSVCTPSFTHPCDATPSQARLSDNNSLRPTQQFNLEKSPRVPEMTEVVRLRDGEEADSCDQNAITPRNSLRGSCSELHYPILQQSNSEGSSESACNSILGNYYKKISSPLDCATPPAFSLAISPGSNSPQSILRRRASNFKYTPSILRKRRHRCAYSEGSQKTVVDSSDSIDTSLKLGLSYQNETCRSKVGSGSDDLLNVKKLAVSSHDSLKTKIVPSIRSLEKRLEYDFDMEWNKDNLCKDTSQNSNVTNSNGRFSCQGTSNSVVWDFFGDLHDPK